MSWYEDNHQQSVILIKQGSHINYCFVRKDTHDTLQSQLSIIPISWDIVYLCTEYKDTWKIISLFLSRISEVWDACNAHQPPFYVDLCCCSISNTLIMSMYCHNGKHVTQPTVHILTNWSGTFYPICPLNIWL